MAPVQASNLSNPLATPDQLASSGSQLDGIPADLEDSLRFAGARLTQMAGVLLKLPQDIIAQAIVIFTRFWLGTEGGSFREYGVQDVSSASLYMTAKLSAHPKSPRSVLNVYAYLSSFPSTYLPPSTYQQPQDPEAYYVSEGTYHALRAILMKTEAHVLRVLGFDTHVALPYTLCINYLQALDVIPGSADVAKRAFAHLNSALLSPQLLYLTHQPPALATAAIYLAAREAGFKLPSEEWWEVFDTDREELGFLVVGLMSVGGFAEGERERWGRRKVPMSLEEVEGELERRKMLEGGE
ncbi:hypothetical protein K490DRAFT_47946 [Saccharata proteae CBS 121410]|uniref:Cyclin domain-containing protein n=1 Tax=Saccharata proteae CBS 121410 TaxID=1314787 RepID=A0A9P4HS76_9PEZI|nr:hypothetical protein K490DRAFT_47946 [Saccharata proteae CBS 121410]